MNKHCRKPHQKKKTGVKVPDWNKIHAKEERRKQNRLEKLKKPTTKVEEFHFNTTAPSPSGRQEPGTLKVYEDTDSKRRASPRPQGQASKANEDNAFLAHPSSLNAILSANDTEQLHQKQRPPATPSAPPTTSALESVLTRERLEAHRRRRETIALAKSVKPSPRRRHPGAQRSLLHSRSAASQQHHAPVTPGRLGLGASKGVNVRRETLAGGAVAAAPSLSASVAATPAVSRSGHAANHQQDAEDGSGFEPDAGSKEAIVNNTGLSDAWATTPLRQTLCPSGMRAAERRRQFFEQTPARHHHRMGTTPKTHVHRARRHPEKQQQQQCEGDGEGARVPAAHGSNAHAAMLRTPSDEHLRRAPKSPKTKPSLVSHRETLLTPHRTMQAMPAGTQVEQAERARAVNANENAEAAVTTGTAGLRLSVQRLSQSIMKSTQRQGRTRNAGSGGNTGSVGHIRSFNARIADALQEEENEDEGRQGGVKESSVGGNTPAPPPSLQRVSSRRHVLEAELARIRAEEERLERELLAEAGLQRRGSEYSDAHDDDDDGGDRNVEGEGGVGGNTKTHALHTLPVVVEEEEHEGEGHEESEHTGAATASTHSDSAATRLVDAFDLVQQLRRDIDGAATTAPTVMATVNSSGRSATTHSTCTTPSASNTSSNRSEHAAPGINGHAAPMPASNATTADSSAAYATAHDDEGEDEELVAIFFNAVANTLQGTAPPMLEPRLPGDPVAERLHQLSVEEDKEFERRVSTDGTDLPLGMFRPITSASCVNTPSTTSMLPAALAQLPQH
ncbi:hypothetical protein PTSG_00706 [Salpingoeca rosetta]|uniref:Uncharacterized protein n=1 Tax=Salpingoeca rosetta (strain ATCC 50818 / BSB-021) TaxID=946362 RepID=F2TX90_SALR5|nr:uncharacterized protein PTSG_00706 [Salpingoeca rosetta]EGD75999.1 hypothetical protein PTSG_00706 [Salpingoeca rosetta]|eukprot:XP_004998174.1 hypothetical protein PTSG_00706 [Salpingoeca rosetta]